MVATHRNTLGRGRRISTWVVMAIVAIVLFVVLWVSIRALMARDQLLGAVPLAHTISSSALSTDSSGVQAEITELRQRATSAASLTSDPIWRAVEVVPFVGPNLTAFRQAAAMIHDVADDALPPLGDLASTFTVGSLTPKDGAFDLEPFVAAAPMLDEASTALDTAGVKAAEIDTADTIPQIGEAVDQLVDLVGQARDIVGGLDNAAALLPAMLGADEPRTYLLLSLNNAELRATGGIPGAITVLTADDGKLSLGEQTSAAAIGKFAEPVLPLTDDEDSLFQAGLATFMQDVNFTPDFARTGELAQAMWQQKTGDTVDGVIAIDPVALSYILSATGPVDAGGGLELTAENAVQTLLSDVYAEFEDPSDQDAFFAGVTGRIFEAVTSGAVDGNKLIDALSRSAGEERIHIWSADSDEETRLAMSSLSGPLPTTTETTSGFGVYLNDATGAKMDYYVDGAINISAGMCRSDSRPNYEVSVQLKSTAPADAATSLPEYVTGGGSYGVAPGNVDTIVYVYAPEGSRPFGASIDGVQYSFIRTEHDGRAVAGLKVELEPGQDATIAFQFVGAKNAPAGISLVHTPLARNVDTAIDNYLDCTGLVPDEDDGDVSGALGSATAVVN